MRALAKRSRLDLHSVIGKQRVASESPEMSLNATSLVFDDFVDTGGAGTAEDGGKPESELLFLDLFVGRSEISSRSDCDDSSDDEFSEVSLSKLPRCVVQVMPLLVPLFRSLRRPPRL